jgi:hypothetical protein
MKKYYQIPCPIVVKSFSCHNELKNNLLSLINNNISSSISKPSEQVTRSDWEVDIGSERKYFELLYPFIIKDIEEMFAYTFKNQSVYQPEVQNYWFHQYRGNNKDKYDWHDHFNVFYAGVYYLDLPKKAPITQFHNYYDNTVFTPDICEGDIIIFPGFIRHRSIPFKSKKSKTIIGINFKLKE